MIAVTKLNGKAIVVNAELIKFVEKTPDTMITLTTGERIMVAEAMEEIIERAVSYARRIRCFSADGPTGGAPGA